MKQYKLTQYPRVWCNKNIIINIYIYIWINKEDPAKTDEECRVNTQEDKSYHKCKRSYFRKTTIMSRKSLSPRNQLSSRRKTQLSDFLYICPCVYIFIHIYTSFSFTTPTRKTTYCTFNTWIYNTLLLCATTWLPPTVIVEIHIFFFYVTLTGLLIEWGGVLRHY